MREEKRRVTLRQRKGGKKTKVKGRKRIRIEQ
jgi:hypothetical protein